MCRQGKVIGGFFGFVGFFGFGILAVPQSVLGCTIGCTTPRTCLEEMQDT